MYTVITLLSCCACSTDDEPALLQERESLQLPFHGNQPCSFVCVTQFEDSPRTGRTCTVVPTNSGSAFGSTDILVANISVGVCES